MGFRITDNGIGFADANMLAFCTLDTEYKADKGGRGVGRLLWLKAFNRVLVDSIYQDQQRSLKSRAFEFTSASGVRNVESRDAPAGAKRSTCVQLSGFGKLYRAASRKTARAIATSLLEHCLWYFVRKGGSPSIAINDGDERVDLNEVYDQHMFSSAETESVEVKGNKFDLTHVKLRANSSQSHIIAFCAAKRLVKEENLAGKIPGLYGRLTDKSGDFVYACYVTSELLDRSVRPERTDFDITDNVGELFADTEVSFSEIRAVSQFQLKVSER